jgi:short-subunit dehydrogenase
MRWNGATVIVTGGSRGIGRAIAEAAVARGGRVGLVARSGDELAVLCDQLGGPPRATYAVADLTIDAELEAAFASLREGLGTVDILVNNAGIGSWGALVEVPADEAHRVIGLNLIAAMRLTSLATPGMIHRRRGHIVNVGSIAGRVGAPFESAYSASKFGLAGFTEALAVELRPFGVGVSMVNPGPVITGFDAAAGVRSSRPRWLRPVPPERVAAAVISAVERGDLERTVPRWLRLAQVARTVVPGAYLAGAPRAVAGQLAEFERRWADRDG